MSNDETWEARFHEQAARLAAVEDERAICDTLYRYCHSLDYGLEDDFVDCFTADATWCWTVRDADLQAFLTYAVVPIGDPAGVPTPEDALVAASGAEQLRAMVHNHTSPPARWHKHCVMNTRVEITGDTAHANSYFVRVDASRYSMDGFIRAFGRYHDDLVRGDDGRWRISRRYTQLECHTDEVAPA
ncbi:MAG TPA: nuclear transport factor 2 family protein [Ilumatobacteraceae bacterium]